MFERPTPATRRSSSRSTSGAATQSERLAEISALAASAGATVVGNLGGRRARPDPALFAGRGKVDEIATQRRESDADLVIFDHALSGVQQRNLEQALECRVVDRASLILDIFAQRARSAEGKLQVELAQLEPPGHAPRRRLDPPRAAEGRHRPARPGETQLETDRRLIAQRVKLLRERLRRVARSRATQSRTRRRAAVRTVALVGYTNAGKSTLFNRLTARQGLRGQPALRDARHDAAPAARARRREPSCCPTPSASSATCRTTSSPRSAPRSPRPPTPTCCCT